MRKVMSALWNENVATFLGGFLGAVLGGFLMGGLGAAIGVGVGVSLAILRFHSLNQTPKVLDKTGRCPGDNEA